MKIHISSHDDFYQKERLMRSKNGAIILIVLGVIFLLSNLDILPLGDIKSLLRQWWPLILIIVGIIHLRR